MISIRIRKCRFHFARRNEEHGSSYWPKGLFNERKFYELCSDDIQYVRRRKDQEFNPICIVSTLQAVEV